MNDVKKVAVVMGSDSDFGVMSKALDVLEQFQVDYEVLVASAHRTPDKALAFSESAREQGFGVIIAGAGAAAHLGGVLAAKTTLPVIGVPINATALSGVDALYATVQMPSGIPVATVAIDGAKNAALLAVQMLAIHNASLAEALAEYKAKMAQDVAGKNQVVQEKVRAYKETK